MTKVANKYNTILNRLHHDLVDTKMKLVSLLINESDYNHQELDKFDTNKLIVLGKSSLHIATRHIAQQCERVDAAICAVDVEMYGFCCDCDNPIETYDLEADPAEPRCFECRAKRR